MPFYMVTNQPRKGIMTNQPGLRTIVRKQYEDEQRKQQEQRRRANLAAFRQIASASEDERRRQSLDALRTKVAPKSQEK